MLIVMAGLPGSGKSSVAEAAARRLGCAMVSVDPIEAAMWTAGIDRRQPTGLAAYIVAEAIAREQLVLGNDVIVDAVNDAEPARRQWRDVARTTGAALLFVEVVCSDETEHRLRLEQRSRNLPGFPEPTWESVVARRAAFLEWTDERLRIDALRSLDESASRIVDVVTSLREPR